MFTEGNHRQLKPIIDTIGTGLAIFEHVMELNQFNLLSANVLYEEMLETDIQSCIKKNIQDLFTGDIEKPLMEKLNECRVTLESKEVVLAIDNGRWWRFIFYPIINGQGICHRIINTCIEMTEQKKIEKALELSHRRFDSVVEAAYDGIISIDEKHNISRINDAALEVFGITEGKDSVIGNPLTDFMPMQFREKHPDYVNSFSHSMVNSRPMQNRAPVMGLRKDGTEFPIEVTISKVKVKDRTEMTAVFRDISVRTKLLDELTKAAKEDDLTHLINRRYFTELLAAEMERSKRFDRYITLAMFDIDHFKNINDTYGHDAGDYVLKELSKVLMEHTRDIDHCARWGGEEFLILFPEATIKEGMSGCERILQLTRDLCPVFNGVTMPITVSIGMTSMKAKDIDSDMIIKKVDALMYEAKKGGRNRIVSG